MGANAEGPSLIGWEGIAEAAEHGTNAPLLAGSHSGNGKRWETKHCWFSANFVYFLGPYIENGD